MLIAKINEKLDKKPAANNYILAFNIELYGVFLMRLELEVVEAQPRGKQRKSA